MLLSDKGYYDYDFDSEPIKDKKRKERMRSKEAREVWSQDKLNSVLGRLIDPDTGKRILQQELSTEQKRELVLKEQSE